MKQIGEIAFILNSKFAVAKTSQSLMLGSEIVVFDDVPVPEEVKTKYSLTTLAIPKGKLMVVMFQGNDFYLLSTISNSNGTKSTENDSLARNLSIYKSIFGSDIPTETNKPNGELVNYSAMLDTKSGINAKMNMMVASGDPIGILN
jgi:hypothetical protein